MKSLWSRGPLIALSGARSEILDQCPTERVKFQMLGWAILITSGMATVSMWFALTSAMGINPVVALPAALMWGLIIMGIDRWLVTSIPSYGSRRLLMALPRLVLAVLLGTVISTPLVLRIFESEINAQITIIKEQRAGQFLKDQARSQVGRQVTYWENNLHNLQKVIDSGGTVALNPSADPVVKSLTTQRVAELKLQQKYYKQWQCQLYGGPDCRVKGNGPLAHASERSYDQAKAQVATLTSQIQQREQRLSSQDTASKKLRLRQAREALPNTQQQLSTARQRETELQQSFDARNEETNGLLIRLQALSELTGKNETLDAARILLFLLFLVIECLPVTVKLMQRPGNYEEILQMEAKRELRVARARSSGQGVGPGAAAASRATLEEIWQPTRPLYQRRSAPSAAADPPTEDYEDTGGLYDSSLRGMSDTRSLGEEWPGEGVELNYADDDR